MADRYQDRPFPADDDYDREGHQSSSKSDSDPLAELARLIGQTDPFASIGGRANQPAPPREASRDRYHEPETEPALEADDAPAGPPPWMQRAAAQIPSRGDDSWQDDDSAPQGLPSSLHPVQRYAASHAPAEPEPEAEYHQAPLFAHHADHQPHDADPDRYDDALYGEVPGALAAPPPETNYDEPYSYQDDYADGADEPAAKPRRGGMITVAVVLVLAVVGTGAAFAYRTYVTAPRSGDPPIFKADPTPTKVVPPTQSADASGKLIQDRMGGGATGTGTEKIVSREEQPVDLKDPKGGPRVVFPPLNQNANPPPPSSVAPGSRPVTNAGNGTMGEEPKKIRTFAVRGDQADTAPVTPPVTQPAPMVRSATPAAPQRTAPSPTPPQGANAPLSLSPQTTAAPPPPPAETRRMAANASAGPQQIAPPVAGPAPAPTGGGGFLVQVSSQRNESDAQASFKSLQGKYPSVLGSRQPLIRRADLGEKGIYYRAMVGPFGSTEEASQFCGSLKSAGGGCVIQRN
jgi:hypothetical protein